MTTATLSINVACGMYGAPSEGWQIMTILFYLESFAEQSFQKSIYDLFNFDNNVNYLQILHVQTKAVKNLNFVTYYNIKYYNQLFTTNITFRATFIL